MDLPQVLSFAETYATEYIGNFARTLAQPKLLFSPQCTVDENQSSLLAVSPRQTTDRLNVKLVGFVVISLFVGGVFNRLTMADSSEFDYTQHGIVAITMWLALSLISHVLCRVAGGRGTLAQTVSITLQLFAVLYVLATFVCFIWAALMKLDSLRTVTETIPFMGPFAEAPRSAYLPVHALLMIVYLPRALSPIHGFRVRLGRNLLLLILIFVVIIMVNVVGRQLLLQFNHAFNMIGLPTGH